MQKLEVVGANKLKGQIKISGSKNASLPILAATLLSRKKVYLKNLPRVKDIETMVSLLQSLGSKIYFDELICHQHIEDQTKIVSILKKKIYLTKNCFGKLRLKVLPLQWSCLVMVYSVPNIPA